MTSAAPDDRTADRTNDRTTDRTTRRRGRTPPTPAGRIRRLRRRVAILFTLISALAVIGMGVVALHANDDSWHSQVDSELKLQTGEFAAEVSYDDDGNLQYPDPGDGDYDCPPITLFRSTANSLSPVATAKRPCAAVPATAAQALAAQASQEGDLETATITDHGRHLRMSAQPSPGPGSDDGTVVVTTIDITGDLNSQERFTVLIAVASVVLLATAALAGYWLSGRAVRPALAALDQQEAFFADAAHDLRTPVASLRVLAETGLRGEVDTAEVMRRTLRQSTRMSELVDDLLTRARLRAGALQLNREPLRLDQLVEAVVADTPAAGHTVTVQAEPTIVVADAALVRRAVANLLGNALAHGHAPNESADVQITVDPEGTVAVDDAGPGIPPATAESLFERFHSGAGSSGLGLSIAAWVAHAHGGSLKVTTSARGGARFILRIPSHK